MLLACSASPGLVSAPMLQSSPDFVRVDLATNTQIQLSTQASFTQISLRAKKEFRFDKMGMLESELFYLLLRLDHNSQLLLSLDSVEDIYALWKNDVFYYGVSII